ncbi:MAG: hypothetical protein HY698_13350 [Deltaproteobacteria bacterium]|nr:hypothetical protein [Deltaproteobacteria bacterium]
MPQVTKTERKLEEAIRHHAGDPDRVLVLERARKFKRSWIELAEVLVRVREDGSHRRWGFASFDDYCTQELHLKRVTVDKLCASYGFLASHAPRLVEDERRDERPIPSLQAVDFLARAAARGAADEDTFSEMKRAVFDDGLPAPLLSRKFREVAFPLADEEKRDRLRGQLLATARKLADLVSDPGAPVSQRLAERIERDVGELIAQLGRTEEDQVAPANAAC